MKSTNFIQVEYDLRYQRDIVLSILELLECVETADHLSAVFFYGTAYFKDHTHGHKENGGDAHDAIEDMGI
jgi:hypothetical protein